VLCPCYRILVNDSKYLMGILEWGRGFKLWRIPQEDNKISLDVVGTLLKLRKGDEIINMLSQEELQDVVTYQVMTYLEKIWRNDVKDIAIKIRTNETVSSIPSPKELKGIMWCAVDYYKKIWVLMKQNNNEMIWARIDWRNERYYVSVVQDENKKQKLKRRVYNLSCNTLCTTERT
jgi:hypothetical protein